MSARVEPTTHQSIPYSPENTTEGRLPNNRIVRPLLLDSGERGGACALVPAHGGVILLAIAICAIPFVLGTSIGAITGTISGVLTANPLLGVGVGVAVTILAVGTLYYLSSCLLGGKSVPAVSK